MPKEIAAPARTHTTGTNQRLDPTLTASFRNHIGRVVPNRPASHACTRTSSATGRLGGRESGSGSQGQEADGESSWTVYASVRDEPATDDRMML